MQSIITDHGSCFIAFCQASIFHLVVIAIALFVAIANITNDRHSYTSASCDSSDYDPNTKKCSCNIGTMCRHFDLEWRPDRKPVDQVLLKQLLNDPDDKPAGDTVQFRELMAMRRQDIRA